jgi:hypothetical protein
MQRGILFSVRASMLMDVSGCSIAMAQTWFTAQAQTVQHGRQLQQSEPQAMDTYLASGLMGRICIMLMEVAAHFVIGVDYLIVMEQ